MKRLMTGLFLMAVFSNASCQELSREDVLLALLNAPLDYSAPLSSDEAALQLQQLQALLLYRDKELLDRASNSPLSPEAIFLRFGAQTTQDSVAAGLLQFQQLTDTLLEK